MLDWISFSPVGVWKYVKETSSKIVKYIHNSRYSNPHNLYNVHYRNNKLRASIYKIYSELKSAEQEPYAISKYDKKLRQLAEKCEAKAQLNWGRNIIKSYISAYYYTLAAEAYLLLGEYRKAGYNYHFAAHTFRTVSAYNKSVCCYYRASTVFLIMFQKESEKRYKNEAIEYAVRSLRRGIAICLYNLCESDLAKDLCEELKELKSYHGLLQETNQAEGTPPGFDP